MKKLYLGAAFYPEIYGKDLPTMEQDIRMMKKGGFNLMRIAEFSWSSMEMHDGEYDFTWLHRIVDTLAENGIKTLMCTPSVTPPAWLTRKYPEILAVDETGRRKQHGARRHCCSNAPIYRQYSARIAAKMAREFAPDPNIIGWQIDNEIAPQKRGCFCPDCLRAFRRRLSEKYGTVAALNRAWNLGMWSQEYESFEDVPAPEERTWSNPSLIAEYIDFQSDSNADFVHMQARVLRENGVTVPIGTDMMPTFVQHYPKTVRDLDVVQFNHYNHRENLWLSTFWFSYLHGLKPDVPFWNTETATSFNGSAASPAVRYPLGFCRVNSLLPFALGGEMNSYWLWRQHPSGHELMHGYVISTQGRPVYNFNEIEQVRDILDKTEDFFSSTKPARSGFAMSASSTVAVMFQACPTVADFAYNSMLPLEYKALIGTGMLPEIIEPGMPLDGVKVLYSPYLMTLEHGDFMSRLEKWIAGGGIWIAGPLTDIRDSHIAKYPDSPYGMIERITGIYNDFGLAASHIPARVRWFDGSESPADIWTDVYTLAPGMESLGEYSSCGEEPSPLEGRAAAAFCPVGKGGVIVLGTHPDAKALRAIVAYAYKKAGLAPDAECSANVIAVRRTGDREGLVLAELEAKAGWSKLDGDYVDLVSGCVCSGEISLSPYDFKVLVKVM